MDNLNVFAAPRNQFLIKHVFSRGNSKLGKSVMTFSLPAIVTCPGSSELCRSLCYATRPFSYFAMPNVQKRYWRNLTLSRRPDFADIAIAQLKSARRKLVRWHVSGDIYDATYAAKLLRIVAASPDHKHWIYTRSWRQPTILPALLELVALPQVQLWFSCDRETGAPKQRSPFIRLAYMQVSADDQPAFAVDLVFRENALRNVVQKHVDRVPVCPVENGVTKTTCQQCRVCLVDPEDEPNRRTGQRFALPVLV